MTMIFDIGILFILIIGFLRGIHRGLVVELFNLVGFFAATIGAIIFTTPVSDFLAGILNNHSENTSMGTIIKWIVFIVVFVIITRLVRMIRNMIRPVTKLPLISQVNSLLGGGVNLISHYLLVFIILSFLLILPSQAIHQQYDQSAISQWIVTKTPILSDKMMQIWDENSSEVNV
ncbi:CvpA family protein [Lentilactobacillus rapi DSM 19907 = JCM 15042]|nr:CvpA family protein [Lentilactobacillus rapi DSM 19907 = JCM 15042]